MIPKVGDTARGFRFRNYQNSERMIYWSAHEDCEGMEGTISRITCPPDGYDDKNSGILVIYFPHIGNHLAYPMQEFLADNKQWLRERRLVELGIE